ncbi:MAG TPA: glycosyltransferase family 4 protein [Acidimicrobiales bacterium]|nr:glycosyltransferase family 4 protein [Acidimicrobiales bacterium]
MTHAGGEFLLRYLDALATQHQVMLLAPGTGANKQIANRCPEEIDLHLWPVEAPRHGPGSGFRQRVLSNVGGLASFVSPATVRSFSEDPRVRAILADSQVVELQWPENLAFVRAVKRIDPAVPLTAFLYDVLSQSMGRQLLVDERDAARRFARKCNRALVVRQERKRLNECAAIFVLSEKDRAILENIGVRAPIHVLDPLVSFGLEMSPGPVGRMKKKILFTGAMHRPENFRSMLWFIDQVWPAVLDRAPDATLVVAGADPPEILRRRSSSSVTITGFVPDLRSFYEDADVFVAPLLTGAGVKFKILDAMGAGLPVVATPVAVEGIVEESGPSLFALISVDPDEIAKSIIALIDDGAAARRIGKLGKEWVTARYSFSDGVKRAVGIYDAIQRA